MSIVVTVQKEVEFEHIPTVNELKIWAETSCQNSDISIELNVRIVGKDEIQNLNKLYRGRDQVTNVLSFASHIPEGTTEAHVLADVVICAEQVAAEAAEYGKAVKDRWAHMLVHGCLHVQGFDHEDEEEREFMEAEERKILAKLRFSDPYLA